MVGRRTLHCVPSADAALLRLVRAIGEGDTDLALRLLADEPETALDSLTTGATREDPGTYWLAGISHHVYAGDTALHVAAAAHDPAVVDALLEVGAIVDARNRRGAAPLHYAADGAPDASSEQRRRQSDVIAALVAAGADPNVRDKSGVAPLHRAVRARCAAAVEALLDGGADVGLANGSGSSPMKLAESTTGKSGSGSAAAREQQAVIVELLRGAGATAS